MQCARCAGLNVPEVMVEGGAKLFVMRCVHCGDVIDHVILINRRRQRSVRPGAHELQSMDIIGLPGIDRL